MLRVLHFVRDAGLDDSILYVSFQNRYKTTRLLFLCKPCVEPIKSAVTFRSASYGHHQRSDRRCPDGRGLRNRESSHDVMPPC